jgi:hypothetical protein
VEGLNVNKNIVLICTPAVNLKNIYQLHPVYGVFLKQLTDLLLKKEIPPPHTKVEGSSPCSLKPYTNGWMKQVKGIIQLKSC